MNNLCGSTIPGNGIAPINAGNGANGTINIYYSMSKLISNNIKIDANDKRKIVINNYGNINIMNS